MNMKTLNGIPDQDTFYDMADSLEEQGMERIVQRFMSKQGTDLDLLDQLQIYEVTPKFYFAYGYGHMFAIFLSDRATRNKRQPYLSLSRITK